MIKIICSGGGTLGPVTPLLAVSQELLKRHPDWQISWWGTFAGPERILVREANLSFWPWPAGKWRRYLSLYNLTDLFIIVYAFLKAWLVLGKERPNLLLTAGGFVAVPIAWAAYLRGIPVLAHQQDVTVGLANRLLKPIAKVFTVTLPESSLDFKNVKRLVITGNAVRQEFLKPMSVTEARQKLGLNADKSTLVFVGGGTGADFINRLVMENLSELIKLGQIIHLTGQGKLPELLSSTDYKAINLTSDSLTVLQAADVVITRAGFGTLSELSALKKPTVVIPMPATHQEANAKLVAQAEAGLVLRQSDLTAERLIDTLSQLLNDKNKLVSLGNNLHNLIPIDGAVKIADEAENIIKLKIKN